MKIAFNGKWLHKIRMRYFDQENVFLSFPEHRIEVVEETSQLVIEIPESLVIPLFLEKLISTEPEKVTKIKIGKEQIRKYYFLDAKIQYDTGRGKLPHVRLYFEEVNITPLE